MAIVDALHEFAPRITTPEMTAELDQDMTRVAEGQDTQEHVVEHSRALLAGMLDALIDHKDDLGDRIADAVTADAKVGTCPKCGKDLVMKTSAKTRGSFIGCMGWPDCDVTYPVPSGVKVSPLEGEAAVCPECGAPRIKCQPFRSKAYEICVNPQCPTNFEPDLKVGECPTCAAAGRHGDLIAHKSERSGKRFIPLHQLRRMRRLLPAARPRQARGDRRGVASIVARPSWWSRRRAALGASASTWTARLKSSNRPVGAGARRRAGPRPRRALPLRNRRLRRRRPEKRRARVRRSNGSRPVRCPGVRLP